MSAGRVGWYVSTTRVINCSPCEIVLFHCDDYGCCMCCVVAVRRSGGGVLRALTVAVCHVGLNLPCLSVVAARLIIALAVVQFQVILYRTLSTVMVISSITSRRKK